MDMRTQPHKGPRFLRSARALELIQSCQIRLGLLTSYSKTPQQFFVPGVYAIHNRLHLKEVLRGTHQVPRDKSFSASQGSVVDYLVPFMHRPPKEPRFEAFFCFCVQTKLLRWLAGTYPQDLKVAMKPAPPVLLSLAGSIRR